MKTFSSFMKNKKKDAKKSASAKQAASPTATPMKKESPTPMAS
jgi:hypothetical protein